MNPADSDIHPLFRPPPEPPRPIGRRARRRSWGEMRVRIAWLIALALFAVSLYFLQRLLMAAGDYSLMRHGTQVQAEILDVNGITIKGKLYEPQLNATFRMRIPLPGRQPIVINHRLKAQRQALGPGMTVPLYIDPNNPSRWTDRRPEAIRDDAIVFIVIVSASAALLLIAFVLRRGILRIWRIGQCVPATIVDIRHSPVAPFSRTLRFTLPDSAQGRIFATLIPVSWASLSPGQTFWVVAPPGRPDRAIPAGAYIDVQET